MKHRDQNLRNNVRAAIKAGWTLEKFLSRFYGGSQFEFLARLEWQRNGGK